MPRRQIDARQTVLESAVHAFAVGGYAGTSIQEILKATGLSKPTLYYYFTSKKDLYRAILDDAYDEAFRRMQEAVARETGCEARLVLLAAALFDFALGHKELVRLMFASVFAASREIPADVISLERRRRNFELVLNVVRQGQKDGCLSSKGDSAELAHAIYGAISHTIRMHLLQPEGRLDRRRASRLVSLFLDGARKGK